MADLNPPVKSALCKGASDGCAAEVRVIHARKVVTVSPRGTIRDGAIAVQGSVIAAVGTREEISALYPDAELIYAGAVLTPGLIDCHAHNLEFGPSTAFGATKEEQWQRASDLIMRAMRGGITSLGEHVLGFFILGRSIEEYKAFRDTLPVRILISAGTCSLGTDPPVYMCSALGGVMAPRGALVDAEALKVMAAQTEFPGEHAMGTFTPANLPPEATPLAGAAFLSPVEVAAMVEAYHAAGKKCGLHTEGSQIVQDFIDAGGDVVHHGHNIAPHLLDVMAEKGIPLVATPVGGTSSRPNSPEEVLDAVKRGVRVSIATDSVLPPHPRASWLPIKGGRLVYSGDLTAVAHSAMVALVEAGFDEGQALAMITLNPAGILGIEGRAGSLEPGKDADIIACDAIPGLEAYDPENIHLVMSRGKALHQG
ncbi:MAG: amidohydrolase family protein [Bacillota bacterium]